MDSVWLVLALLVAALVFVGVLKRTPPAISGASPTSPTPKRPPCRLA